jgi:hypothetical protein
LLIAVILFSTLRSLSNPNWALVDDGPYLLYMHQTNAALSSGDYFGAFYHDVKISRYFQYIFLWVKYEICGLDNFSHRLLQVILFTLITLVVYSVANRITKSARAGLLSGLFFCLCLPQVETFYMLVPCEPTIALEMALSFWLIVRLVHSDTNGPAGARRMTIMGMFFLVPLIYFTKEIGMIFIPISFMLWLISLVEGEGGLFRPRRRVFLAYFIFNVVVGAIVLYVQSLLLFVEPGSYEGGYQPTPFRMVTSLGKYFDILWNAYNVVFVISMLSFLFYFVRAVKRNGIRKLNHSTLFESVLLLWFLAGLCFLLPWQWQLGRYLVPVNVGLSVFMGIQIEKLIQFLSCIKDHLTHSRTSFKALLAYSFAVFIVLFLYLVLFVKSIAVPKEIVISLVGLTGVLTVVSLAIVFKRYVANGTIDLLTFRILRLAVPGSMIVMILCASARIFYFSDAKVISDRIAMRMFETVAATSRPGGSVLFDSPSISNMIETMHLLKSAFGRGDLRFIFAGTDTGAALKTGDMVLVFSGKGKGHTPTVSVTDNPHYESKVNSLKVHTEVETVFREEKKSFTMYPDAFLFNFVVFCGFHPPNNLGMFDRSYRSLFEFPSIVQEWKIMRVQ